MGGAGGEMAGNAGQKSAAVSGGAVQTPSWIGSGQGPANPVTSSATTTVALGLPAEPVSAYSGPAGSQGSGAGPSTGILAGRPMGSAPYGTTAADPAPVATYAGPAAAAPIQAAQEATKAAATKKGPGEAEWEAWYAAHPGTNHNMGLEDFLRWDLGESTGPWSVAPAQERGSWQAPGPASTPTEARNRAQNERMWAALSAMYNQPQGG